MIQIKFVLLHVCYFQTVLYVLRLILIIS